METQAQENFEDISKLRQEIDAIDAQIAHLIVKRTQIARAVALSKTYDSKNSNQDLSFGWRPKREVEILRHLEQLEPSLEPKLCYMIWRAMITRNLASQGKMEVICIKQTDGASRIGFGAAVTPKIVENCDVAIDIAAKEDNIIAALPWPSNDELWWQKLLLEENQSLKINMVLPHYDNDTPPEALCIAKVTPLETKNDYSLFAAMHNVEIPNDAKLLSQTVSHKLWLIKGFYKSQCEANKDLVFLGSYAIV